MSYDCIEKEVEPLYPLVWEWQNPEYETASGGDYMNFRLIYEGQLVSQGSDKRVANKNLIRRQIHDQLKELWHRHPALNALNTRKFGNFTSLGDQSAYHATIVNILTDKRWPVPNDGDTQVQAIGQKYEKGGIEFVPLVNDFFGLVCGLDILFLRREKPGAIIQGGDIDNRIKTLLDALRVPKHADEMKGSGDAVSPLFCLMSDDSLITDLKVTTDRLLTPSLSDSTHPDADVHLIIHVTVRPQVDNLEGFSIFGRN